MSRRTKIGLFIGLLVAVIVAVSALSAARRSGRATEVRIEPAAKRDLVAVVTASGRVTFEGSGYAPDGAVQRDGGGPIDGTLRTELERALAAADRANNATVMEHDGRWSVQGDPTEGALLVAARKAGLSAEALDERLPRIGEVPFSSERKLMTTIHSDADRQERLLVFTKGAPDVLLARCTREYVGEQTVALTRQRREQIFQINEDLAGQALRTLGVAARELKAGALPRGDMNDEVEQDLMFLGLIGMIDPPREEAREAVARQLLVVDHQGANGRHRRQAACGRVAGRVSSTRVPSPGRLMIAGVWVGPERRCRRSRRLRSPTPRS